MSLFNTMVLRRMYFCYRNRIGNKLLENKKAENIFFIQNINFPPILRPGGGGGTRPHPIYVLAGNHTRVTGIYELRI